MGWMWIGCSVMAETTVAVSAPHRHLDRLEGLRPRMAKALKNLEDRPWREQIGRAIERAISIAGLSQKEAAALLDRDQAQVARWVSSTERPQLDAIFAVPVLRGPIVIALAELSQDIDVVTQITVTRRTA